MFTFDSISGGVMDNFLVATSLLGVLLLVATFIRVRISLLRRWYISASLLAGVIGLILGPYVLGVIPAEITSIWSTLSGRLIVLVFAPMLITGSLPQFKKLANTAGPQVVWSYSASFVQYAVPCLLSALLLGPMFGVDDLFATIVEQGWAGGHGTAGGMAAVFEELGYADGASLSVTSATIGLVFGIVGGTIMINYAARHGLTTNLGKAMSGQEESELIPVGRRAAASNTTISRNVIDVFAFHAAIVSSAVVIGYILMKLLKSYLSFSVSWFVTAMIGGLIVQLLILKTKWNDCIDRPTMSRIQGISLEFLVAGAVASVKIPVVVQYAIPLLIQQLIIMVIMTWMVFWFARRIFSNNWFEHSMVLFGTFCGVAATGLMLLRIVDPDMKTDVGEAFAARGPFCATVIGGGLLTGIVPGLVIRYGVLNVGLCFAAGFIVTMILPRVFGWWYKPQRAKVASQQQ